MHPDEHPDYNESPSLNAAIIRQLPTYLLFERINLILCLVHRYITNGDLLAATYARYSARIGMELLDRKDRPYLQDERRFQMEKEIELELRRIDIEHHERVGTWSPDEVALMRQELELAVATYRIEQAKAYMEEWTDDTDNTGNTDKTVDAD